MQRAAAQGRDPRKILVYAMATVIVDETCAAARAKHEDDARYASDDGALVLMSSCAGIGFRRHVPGATVKKAETNATGSTIGHQANGEKTWAVDLDH